MFSLAVEYLYGYNYYSLNFSRLAFALTSFLSSINFDKDSLIEDNISALFLKYSSTFVSDGYLSKSFGISYRRQLILSLKLSIDFE
jgi:hypothetical protein